MINENSSMRAFVMSVRDVVSNREGVKKRVKVERERLSLGVDFLVK